MDEFQIKKGVPYPLGATVMHNGINFAVPNYSNESCGVVLYSKDGKKEPVRIPFNKKNNVGNISCMFIRNIDVKSYNYNYFGEDEWVDPYAKRVIGNEVWGEDKTEKLYSGFLTEEFDWQKTSPLHIDYSDSIIYCLHVRGFTKHESSKVKHKGTFLGIIEKIPYLKELGITAIELMPSYEFDEKKQDKNDSTMSYAQAHIGDIPKENSSVRLNYWGYQDAYYFAPKASYAYTENPVTEMKTLIRELHKNGIEIIMQFYFPDKCKQGYIFEVLRYWVMEYMIDGFHLKGNHIPITLLATDPLLANTKIMYNDFPIDEIYPKGETPTYKNLAYYRDEFMQDMRKFLKSDMDMLKSVQFHMQNHPDKAACINYISNYYGFTLADLVSYDRKHNEANGENNQDGTDYNYSWNCGIEGETRKTKILSLRKRQIKNALTFVLLSQGTPLIMSGDEMGNSQQGNNNPYCQDNEISWLNWKTTRFNKQIFDYTKELIRLRKSHPILHRHERMLQMDTISCGYPDLSYHGEEAWRVRLENYNRHIAYMYCGKYCSIGNRKHDDYFYFAFNMYWEEKIFALPRLPEGLEWECVVDTYKENSMLESSLQNDDCQQLPVSGRSIKILKSRRKVKQNRKA